MSYLPVLTLGIFYQLYKYGKFPIQVNTDTGIIDVSLTIRNVTKATYKVYNLVASNRIGRTEMNIAFMEGKSPFTPSVSVNTETTLR